MSPLATPLSMMSRVEARQGERGDRLTGLEHDHTDDQRPVRAQEPAEQATEHRSARSHPHTGRSAARCRQRQGRGRPGAPISRSAGVDEPRQSRPQHRVEGADGVDRPSRSAVSGSGRTGRVEGRWRRSYAGRVAGRRPAPPRTARPPSRRRASMRPTCRGTGLPDQLFADRARTAPALVAGADAARVVSRWAEGSRLIGGSAVARSSSASPTAVPLVRGPAQRAISTTARPRRCPASLTRCASGVCSSG